MNPSDLTVPRSGLVIATDRVQEPGTVAVMSAVDHPDLDAITVDNRHSYRSSDPLKDSTEESDKEDVMEHFQTPATQGMSEDLKVESVEPPTGVDSPGYTRAQTLASTVSFPEKTVIFILIMVLATAHSLDNCFRVLYEFEVGWKFGAIGKLAALSSISFVSTASLTPMISKNADIFGRPETLLASVIFYVLGTALQANALKKYTLFCAGSVLWTIGFMGVVSMFEIIIADLTSIRMRVIMWYLPAIPYLITPWISGPLVDVLRDVLPRWTNRFAGSAIVYSACASALIISMFVIESRVKKRLPMIAQGKASQSGRQSYRRLAALGLSRLQQRIIQMDVIGCVMLAGFLSCIIAPWGTVPIVDREENYPWKSRSMVFVICAGLLCVPLLYIAERWSKYPMFPAELLRERRVRIATAMGFLYHLAYYVHHTYLYLELIIRYNVSPEQASWIAGLYAFTSTLFGLFMGMIISINQDVRWYLRIGAILFLCSFGLQMVRPTGTDNAARLSVTCSQLLLGIAGGLFPFPAMGFIQAGREHAKLSTLIGIYMTACRVGGGVGQALVGALWINIIEPKSKKVIIVLHDWKTPPPSFLLPPELMDALYPWGTPIRKAMVEIHVEVNRYICAVGIIASALLIFLAFSIREASFDNSGRAGGPETCSKTQDDIELQEGIKAATQLRPSRHPILF